MDFFGMGMGEILLILIIAMIIFGPGRMVEIAKTLGKTMRSLRKATTDFTTTITREVEMEEKKLPSPPKTSSDDRTKGASDAGTAESSSKEVTDPRD